MEKKKFKIKSYLPSESFVYNHFYEDSDANIKFFQYGYKYKDGKPYGNLERAQDPAGNTISFKETMRKRNLDGELNIKEYIEFYEQDGNYMKKTQKKYYNNSKIFEIILNEHPDLNKDYHQDFQDENHMEEFSDSYVHNSHTDQYDESPFGMNDYNIKGTGSISDVVDHELDYNVVKANIKTELFTKYICSVESLFDTSDMFPGYPFEEYPSIPIYKLSPIKNKLQYSLHDFDSKGNFSLLKYFSFNDDFELSIKFEKNKPCDGYFIIPKKDFKKFSTNQLISKFDFNSFKKFDWKNRFNRSKVFDFLNECCVE